jgi:beta-glucosidase
MSDYFQNHRFTKKICNHVDEIGVNYYQASKYGTELSERKTDMGWNYTPEYLYDALVLMSRYKKPLFVSEAGIADRSDEQRAEYITKQVRATQRAMAEGIDVRGHMYWSLIDNYEWALGTQKCFGLVAVDYRTLERTIRPSAWVYRDMIAANGLSESGETDKTNAQTMR